MCFLFLIREVDRDGEEIEMVRERERVRVMEMVNEMYMPLRASLGH